MSLRVELRSAGILGLTVGTSLAAMPNPVVRGRCLRVRSVRTPGRNANLCTFGAAVLIAAAAAILAAITITNRDAAPAAPQTENTPATR